MAGSQADKLVKLKPTCNSQAEAYLRSQANKLLKLKPIHSVWGTQVCDGHPRSNVCWLLRLRLTGCLRMRSCCRHKPARGPDVICIASAWCSR
jgi:hypothetical protein